MFKESWDFHIVENTIISKGVGTLDKVFSVHRYTEVLNITILHWGLTSNPDEAQFLMLCFWFSFSLQALMLRDKREDSFQKKFYVLNQQFLSSKTSIEPSQEPLPKVFLVEQLLRGSKKLVYSQ